MNISTHASDKEKIDAAMKLLAHSEIGKRIHLDFSLQLSDLVKHLACPEIGVMDDGYILQSITPYPPFFQDTVSLYIEINKSHNVVFISGYFLPTNRTHESDMLFDIYFD